jgi:hypothetical protein
VKARLARNTGTVQQRGLLRISQDFWSTTGRELELIARPAPELDVGWWRVDIMLDGRCARVGSLALDSERPDA